MSGSARRAAVPIEHLDAELLALPLASHTGFRNSIVALDSKMRGGTANLWRETEKELLSRFPGTSIDELVIRRDRIWFDNPDLFTNQSLLNFLRRGLRRLLDSETEMLLGARSPAPNEPAHRWRWRWTVFSLPPDLLLASGGLSSKSDNWICPTLRQMMADRGFAETHLHLKAALDFSDIWSAFQSAIAASEAQETMLEGAGAEFNEGRGFGPWLIRCSLSRLLLGAFLTNAYWRRKGMAAYLRVCAVPGIASVEGSVAAALFHYSVRELAGGGFGPCSPSFNVLRGIYASLIAGLSEGNLGSGVNSRQLDPLAQWFPGRGDTSPEMALLVAAFSYLDDSLGRHDGAFARLFWQTQRLRVFFYRHIIQRPMIPGLQWFTRTYARLKSPRRPLTLSWFVKSAHRLSGAGLRSLELRMVPEDTMPSLVHTVREIDHASRDLESKDDGLEIGVVFHFSRTRGADAELGTPQPWGRMSHDHPGAKSNPSGYRFAGYYLARRREAVSLATSLLTFPRMLERVRGIDLCTDELGVPLWALLPLVEHVRRAGQRASLSLGNSALSLRTTVHAGEDFVHLLGGIRRMGEAVEYLKLSDGDRIGHGVAVGVNVEEWAARTSRLVLPRGERMLDLLWAWRTAMDSSNVILHSWLPWIGQQVERLALEIFQEHCSLAILNKWMTALHSPRFLAATGFPAGPVPEANNNLLRLVLLWLRDRSVYIRSQVLEPVEVAFEVSLVNELQATIRRILALRGIVVEINPTSNLLIGHLGDLTNHPLWRLCPPQRDHQEDSIRVCIGSDDPITFATRLPEEYQLLWDAMVGGGLSSYEADAWLNRARETGLAGRFTVKRSRVVLSSPLSLARMAISP